MRVLFRGSFSNYPKIKRCFSQIYKISDEVKCGLAENRSVVALESTIITHGMPYPDNIKCAENVENIIRQQGAIPATVAILNGIVKIGLEKKELYHLGDVNVSLPIKTSRRDISYVVSNRLNGGTTVSGTLLIANKIGIPIFATGGIGGVHRNGEVTFDISADLIELGKSNVAVVCSGVKSILDIPKTLEYLETQGVFVATFGSNREFPAFYTRKSGYLAPYNVSSAPQAAKVIFSNMHLGTGSGLLFAVPVPEENSLNEEKMNTAISESLKIADKQGIKGKEITPFLLKQIAEITKGESLKANMALIENNAKIAAQMANELAKLRVNEDESSMKVQEGSNSGGKPVVIGASCLDTCIQLNNNEIKVDGRIHYGKFSVTAGGVGRNISEALYKLDCQPTFISVVGDDHYGKILKSLTPLNVQKNIKTLPLKNTAQCAVLLDKKGDCAFIVGDMDIHEEITPSMIQDHKSVFKNVPLIVIDGNLTIPTIEEVLKVAGELQIPVLYETTDLEISIKPFQTNPKLWKNLKFITPNLNELKYIAKFLNISPENKVKDKIIEAAHLAKNLAKLCVDNVVVTLGPDGLLIARKGKACEPLIKNFGNSIQVRHYPTKKIKDIVNVSGAGDCLASGLIAAMSDGLSEENCVSLGFAAAFTSLNSHRTVAETLFDRSHPSWSNICEYKTIEF